MKSYKLIIITPEKEVFNNNAVKISSKNAGGEFEILANFEPFISNTVPTITVIEDESGNKRKLFTSTGVIKVKNNEVVFCLDSAEWSEEIDIERAEKAKERAEKRLSEKDSSNSDIDMVRAEIALARAISRLKLAK